MQNIIYDMHLTYSYTDGICTNRV